MKRELSDYVDVKAQTAALKRRANCGRNLVPSDMQLEAIEGWLECGVVPRPPSRPSMLCSDVDCAGATWKSLAVDSSLITRAHQRLADELERQSRIIADSSSGREFLDW